MVKNFKRRSWICLFLILALALILRLALFLYAPGDPGEFSPDDSYEYIALAQHLDEGYLEPWANTYSWKNELIPNLVVGCFDKKLAAYSVGLRRPPGYPLFLALVFKISGNKYAHVILAQILISLFTIGLTYRLAGDMFGSGPALLAAFLLAIDPISIIYTDYFLAEPLFTFVLAFAVLLWLSGIQKRSVPSSAASGILLGYCILTRPIALYLPLLLLLIGVIYHRHELKRRLVSLLAFTLACGVLAGGWMMHNYQRTGVPVLSTVEGKNYLYYRAGGVIAIERGISLERAEGEVHEMLMGRIKSEPNPGRLNQLEKSLGMEIVLSHPQEAARSFITGASYMLLGPGRDGLLNLLGSDYEMKNVGRFAKITVDIQMVILILAYMGVLLSVYFSIRRKTYRESVILLIIIGYFVVISSGPETYSRFRVPIMPYIMVLSGYGFYSLIGRHMTSSSPTSPFNTHRKN